jgi:hypothetical protein
MSWQWQLRVCTARQPGASTVTANGQHLHHAQAVWGSQLSDQAIEFDPQAGALTSASLQLQSLTPLHSSWLVQAL